MTDFRRDGLIEALLDLGIDLGWQGVTFDETVTGSLTLQDLSLSFMPALRCRAFSRVVQGALLANFSGCTMQAPSSGMWLRSLVNAGAQPVLVWIANTPWTTGSNMDWALVGDEAGQVRASFNPTDFFGPAGTSRAADPSTPGFASSSRGYPVTPGGVCQCAPLWVPPLAFLNAACSVTNTACDIGVDIQFTAQNPGRLP